MSAQKIVLDDSSNPIERWQKIIEQQENSKGEITTYKEFLKPLTERNSISDLILYDAMLANRYAELSDDVNPKSDYYFEKARLNAQKAKLKPLEIWVTVSQATYLYNYRQMTLALPVFVSAIDQIQRTDPTQILFPGQSFRKIAFYFDTIGDYPEAIKYLKKAKEYTPENSADHAAILDNLGINYLKKGDVVKAEENIREASKIAKNRGDDVRYAKTLGSLAEIYEYKKEYQAAIKLVLEDVQISERLESDKNTMYAYTILTRLYLATDQITEAKIAVQKGTAIATSKSYYKINELDLLRLRLNILHLENREEEELTIRRRIEILEDSLNKTDGVLPLNKANWMLQKRKYEQNLAGTNERLAEESLRKNVIIAAALFLIVLVIFISFKAKRGEKKAQVLMDQKIAEYDKARFDNERRLAEATRTLDSQIIFLKEKNSQIQRLNAEIQNIQQSNYGKKETRGKLDELLQSHLMTEENWLNFRREFEREHSVFYKIVLHDFPEITDSNLRVILLQKLGFTNSETAGLLGITIEAVKKSKQRLKRKLGEKYDLLFRMIVSEN